MDNTTIVDINTPLTKDLCIDVLVYVARIAQSKGIYSLEDAELISKCIRFINDERKK